MSLLHVFICKNKLNNRYVYSSYQNKLYGSKHLINILIKLYLKNLWTLVMLFKAVHNIVVLL